MLVHFFFHFPGAVVKICISNNILTRVFTYLAYQRYIASCVYSRCFCCCLLAAVLCLKQLSCNEQKIMYTLLQKKKECAYLLPPETKSWWCSGKNVHVCYVYVVFKSDVVVIFSIYMNTGDILL